MTRQYDLDPFHAAVLGMVQERLPNDYDRQQAEGWSLAALVARLVEEWKQEPVRIPAGAATGPCRRCGEPIAWVALSRLSHQSSITVATGIRHLATCPASIYLGGDYQVTELDRASNFGAF